MATQILLKHSTEMRENPCFAPSEYQVRDRKLHKSLLPRHTVSEGQGQGRWQFKHLFLQKVGTSAPPTLQGPGVGLQVAGGGLSLGSRLRTHPSCVTARVLVVFVRLSRGEAMGVRWQGVSAPVFVKEGM